MRLGHIGRPMFATKTSGVKVWTASYTPFGGVRTTTGTPFTGRCLNSSKSLANHEFESPNPLISFILKTVPSRDRPYPPPPGLGHRHRQHDPRDMVGGHINRAHLQT
jgi:hypothetical protein